MNARRREDWEDEETGAWRKRTSERVRDLEDARQWQRGAFYVLTGIAALIVSVGAWMIQGQASSATHDAQIDAQLESIVQRLERIERKMDDE